MIIKIKNIISNEIIPGYSGKFFHGENMTMAFWNVKKNSKIPEHNHVHEQCLYVKKGCFETVSTVTPDEIALRSGVRLTTHQAVRPLCLAYALTYPSTQGLTIWGVCRIGCTDSPHFTLRHLYGGSSKATAHHLLDVV